MNTVKWGIAMLSIVAVVACGEQETTKPVTEEVTPSTTEIQRETKEATGAIQNFTVEQKEALQNQVQDQLAFLDDKVNDLQAKAANAGDEAKDEIGELTADLKQKLQTAKLQAEQLKDASADNWDNVKTGMTSAINEVNEAYNKVVARMN